jgi:hypothetical protein
MNLTLGSPYKKTPHIVDINVDIKSTSTCRSTSTSTSTSSRHQCGSP